VRAAAVPGSMQARMSPVTTAGHGRMGATAVANGAGVVAGEGQPLAGRRQWSVYVRNPRLLPSRAVRASM